MDSDDLLVELRDVSKSFGATEALRQVSFAVAAGEVHVLAGENGAGKSTLIRILSGVHQRFEGSLLIDGRPARFAGPLDAARAGIATIHQELSLVGCMTVTDNLLLGREDGWELGWTDHRRRRRQAEQILATAGLSLDPRLPVETLPLATRQLLEVARALDRQARIIIMDEPTSALSEREADELFRRIDRLREEDKGVVYISHRMEEIFRVADRITILRDGQQVLTAPAEAISREQLVHTIAGRELATATDEHERPSERSALTVSDLTVTDPARPHRPLVANLSLSVAAGEVLGLAGQRGSGISTVLHALFGSVAEAQVKDIRLGDSAVTIGSPAAAIDHGIVLLTADRGGSVVGEMSVLHNVSLSSARELSRLGWVDTARERTTVQGLLHRLAVSTPAPTVPARTLSGGNQQKVALARCLMTEPQVLLLDEPTRGIDVGAKADVYSLIRQLAAEGVAILLVASETEELLQLSHRVLVLYEGRRSAMLERHELSSDRIVRAAMGGADEAA